MCAVWNERRGRESRGEHDRVMTCTHTETAEYKELQQPVQWLCAKNYNNKKNKNKRSV